MNPTIIGETLISCLGLGAGYPAADEFAELSPADWDRIVRQAIRFQVAPLLYHRLKAAGSETVIPLPVTRKLRESYHANALKNMHLYEELSTIVRTFQDHGLAVIVLKGAHLAKVVYGNIALRRMCDLDLLVKRKDLAAAVKVLSGIGYHPARPFEIEEVCTQSRHLPPFVKDKSVPIEIHWHIEPPDTPFTVDIDGLWQRARPMVVNDVQMPVLSPEDLMLHLCLHAVQHILEGVGLRPLCDLTETMKRYQAEMDWQKLLDRSREWGTDRPLYLMLSLIRELGGQAASGNLLDILKSNPVEPQFVAGLKAHTMMKTSDCLALTTDVARFWRPESPTERIALLVKKAFPSREYLARIYQVPQDSARIYFYYPVRMKDLLLRYGYTLWRLFRRDAQVVPLARLESSQLALRDWLMSR